MRISDGVFVIGLLLAMPAAAETHALSDAVAGHPGVTYADLLKQAVPDLAPEGDHWKGATIPDYQHLLGDSYDNGEPGEFTVSNVDVVHVREGGHDRLLILTSDAAGGTWFQLLAAFDDSPKPKLLDSGNISDDQFSGFYDSKPIALAGGTDAVLVSSTHWNSDQSYAMTSALALHKGKFVKAFTLFTLITHSCELNADQELSFSAKSGGIGVKVDETVAKADKDCTEYPHPKKRSYGDVYRWNAKTGTFKPTTKAIEHLGDRNMKGL